MNVPFHIHKLLLPSIPGFCLTGVNVSVLTLSDFFFVFRYIHVYKYMVMVLFLLVLHAKNHGRVDLAI